MVFQEKRCKCVWDDNTCNSQLYSSCISDKVGYILARCGSYFNDPIATKNAAIKEIILVRNSIQANGYAIKA
jgi:hypothetical protein